MEPRHVRSAHPSGLSKHFLLSGAPPPRLSAMRENQARRLRASSTATMSAPDAEFLQRHDDQPRSLSGWRAATVQRHGAARNAPGLGDEAADAQILPMSSRTSTIRSISPIPPLGP